MGRNSVLKKLGAVRLRLIGRLTISLRDESMLCIKLGPYSPCFSYLVCVCMCAHVCVHDRYPFKLRYTHVIIAHRKSSYRNKIFKKQVGKRTKFLCAHSELRGRACR